MLVRRWAILRWKWRLATVHRKRPSTEIQQTERNSFPFLLTSSDLDACQMETGTSKSNRPIGQPWGEARRLNLHSNLPSCDGRPNYDSSKARRSLLFPKGRITRAYEYLSCDSRKGHFLLEYTISLASRLAMRNKIKYKTLRRQKSPCQGSKRNLQSIRHRKSDLAVIWQAKRDIDLSIQSIPLSILHSWQVAQPMQRGGP